MGAKVKVLAFDALCALFTDVVTVGIESFAVALPIVSRKVAHVTAS